MNPRHTAIKRLPKQCSPSNSGWRYDCLYTLPSSVLNCLPSPALLLRCLTMSSDNHAPLGASRSTLSTSCRSHTTMTTTIIIMQQHHTTTPNTTPRWCTLLSYRFNFIKLNRLLKCLLQLHNPIPLHLLLLINGTSSVAISVAVSVAISVGVRGWLLLFVLLVINLLIITRTRPSMTYVQQCISRIGF